MLIIHPSPALRVNHAHNQAFDQPFKMHVHQMFVCTAGGLATPGHHGSSSHQQSATPPQHEREVATPQQQQQQQQQTPQEQQPHGSVGREQESGRERRKVEFQTVLFSD